MCLRVVYNANIEVLYTENSRTLRGPRPTPQSRGLRSSGRPPPPDRTLLVTWILSKTRDWLVAQRTAFFPLDLAGPGLFLFPSFLSPPLLSGH